MGEIVRLLEAGDELERPIHERRGGAQLPDKVREVIGQRLRRLTTECRELLSAASILGREFGLKESPRSPGSTKSWLSNCSTRRP